MDILGDALRQGIAPAIVVAIYLIITKIIDSRKENAQIKLSADLTKSINTISNFIINLTKNIIDKDKEKCQNAIEDSMYSSGMRLINFVSTTVVNNHIDTNKENVLANIHNIANAEYYTVYSTLSMYIVNDVKVCSALNKDWISAIEKDMVDIIYNPTLSKEDKILLPMLSIFVLVGQSYRDVGSLSILFRKYMFFFTIIRFIGFYNILNLFMIYIKKTISIFENKFNLKDNKFIKLFNKHPFLVSFFVLILCYSIYYIAYYPAVLSPDPSNQIKQAFNVRTKYVDYSIQIDPKVNLTNHHPVLHTLMLGYSVKLGRLLVNDNFGLFIYTFFQGLFLLVP